MVILKSQEEDVAITNNPAYANPRINLISWTKCYGCSIFVYFILTLGDL